MPLTKNPGARTVSGNHAPSVACAAVSPDCDWEPVWISAFSSFPWTRSRIQRSNCRRIPDRRQGDENDEVLWGLRFAFAGDSDLLRWLRGSRRASAAGGSGTATQRASADHSGGPGKLGDRCSSHKPSTAGQSYSAPPTPFPPPSPRGPAPPPPPPAAYAPAPAGYSPAVAYPAKKSNTLL